MRQMIASRSVRWVLVMLGASALSAAIAAPPLGNTLSAIDWRLIERISYGPTTALVLDFETKGRQRWLDDQLQYVGDQCLPAEVAERIQRLPFAHYDPVAWVREQREALKAAKQSGDEERIKRVQREYKQAPIEQAFERRTLRALYCSQPLQERLTAFWFNHFNVYARKAAVSAFLPDYEDTAIRPRVFGKFEDMVLATLTHPAMLEYLDNTQNAAGKINENYARELMELHTLGVDGGYTQQDVQELARILTGAGQAFDPRKLNGRNGWRGAIGAPNGFYFDPARHDDGAKYLLGVRYPAGGGFDEIRRAVHQLSVHPSTAHFIAKKLATFLLMDEPPKPLIDAMAKVFIDTDGDLRAVTAELLRSSAFTTADAYQFKDPQAWLYSALRLQYADDVIINTRPLYKWLNDLGEPTYGRQTPDGYGVKKVDWASADQMTKRFDIARQIIFSAGLLYTPPRDAKLDKSELDDATHEQRAQAAALHPRDPQALWRLAPRYTNAGLQNALAAANGDKERRALVLAAPQFMSR